MSILQKIKDVFGIGGVKVKLDVPAEISKKSGSVKGKLIFTSKSEKHVSNIEIQMKEVWKIGKGDHKEVKEFELGENVLDIELDIKKDETKEISFNLNFELLKSKNDLMQDEEGIAGKLGTVGKFMDGEKSKFFIEVSADVKGTFLGPNDVEQVKMV